jgi:hypothetical protein
MSSSSEGVNPKSCNVKGQSLCVAIADKLYSDGKCVVGMSLISCSPSLVIIMSLVAGNDTKL